MNISYHQHFLQIKSKANFGGTSNNHLPMNSGEKNLEVELEGAIENQTKVSRNICEQQKATIKCQRVPDHRTTE